MSKMKIVGAEYGELSLDVDAEGSCTIELLNLREVGDNATLLVVSADPEDVPTRLREIANMDPKTIVASYAVRVCQEEEDGIREPSAKERISAVIERAIRPVQREIGLLDIESIEHAVATRLEGASIPEMA